MNYEKQQIAHLENIFTILDLTQWHGYATS